MNFTATVTIQRCPECEPETVKIVAQDEDRARHLTSRMRAFPCLHQRIREIMEVDESASRGKPAQYSSEVRAAAVRLLKEGMAQTEVAVELGLSVHQVGRLKRRRFGRGAVPRP